MVLFIAFAAAQAAQKTKQRSGKLVDQFAAAQAAQKTASLL